MRTRNDRAMWKGFLKFLGVALGIVLLGVGALFGLQYWQYRTSDEYRAIQDLKDLERQYAEDPYGGDTPEETLRLFIDALKAGDMELASKYFVLDKQEQWKNDLLIIQEKGLVDEMVRDLERLGNKYPLVEGNDNRFIFEAYNEQKEFVMQADIAKASNGKWKILDL